VTKAHPDQEFMVAQTRRFTDQIATIQQVIASGKIGTLDTITFDHRVYCTVGGYRQKMALPVLEDMIIHHLDALRYITGEDAVSVYAQAWRPKWSQLEGKGSNNVLATLTNDVHVNYFGTWTAKGQLNDYDGIMKIMGSQGSLDLVDSQTLQFYRVHTEDTGPNPAPEHVPLTKLKYREIDGVLHAFLHALETDTQPPCDIDDNLRTFAFNCAVLRSCLTGQVERVAAQ
jgi:predicted dehydrogenase